MLGWVVGSARCAAACFDVSSDATTAEVKADLVGEVELIGEVDKHELVNNAMPRAPKGGLSIKAEDDGKGVLDRSVFDRDQRSISTSISLPRVT